MTTATAGNASPTESRQASVSFLFELDAVFKQRVNEGAQKWAESGRDPSLIAQAMEGKFKPLMEADKGFEAEAELDRLLEQLTKGAK